MKKYWKYIILGLIIVGIVIAVNFKNFEEEFGNTSKDNSNTNNTTNNSNSTKNENVLEDRNENVDLSTLTEEEKNELGKDKVEDFLKIYRNDSPKGILVSLGLLESNHEFSPEDYVDRFYAKTDIKYSEFKSKMLNYMTEDLFLGYFENLGFKESDGILTVSDIGEVVKKYEVTSLEFVENQDDKKVYDIEFKDSDSGESENARISVVENNNTYVVDKYEKK
ncbi:MAG: hypothetical protein IKF52_04505 [Clostridia bacterium]|nr:hypothetical protein [Clostridia bacterium]